MAFERNNTALEFETMLRRHLSRGGSMVEACAGFDADMANAYLENVLGQSARAHYDTHLAGCPSCRRHVIELSRLINQTELSTRTEPQVSPVAAPAGAWANWKSVIAGWFQWPGISAWKPGLVSAGAAATLLIGVFSLQLWRQQSGAPQTNLAMSGRSGASESQPSPSADPLSNQGGNMAEAGGTTNPFSAGLQATPVPKPAVSPMPGTDTLAAAQPNAADYVNPQLLTTNSFASPAGTNTSTTRVGLPVLSAQTTTGTLTPTTVSLSSENFAVRAGASAESAPAPPPPVGTAEANDRSAENAVAARINPSPSDNPMAKKQKTPAAQQPGILGKAIAFLPTRKSDGERKLEEKEVDPDAPKVMTVRINNKVFSFENGIWVDHDYKPEMAWRVTKLVRDGEEFKQVLAAEPQLKAFFDKGAVIVVWKDKIYKVVGK